MKNTENNEDPMQEPMRDVLGGSRLPTGSEIEATVAQLDTNKRAGVLWYVTTYLCTNTSHYPMNAETVREAYSFAFANENIEVIKEGD